MEVESLNPWVGLSLPKRSLVEGDMSAVLEVVAFLVEKLPWRRKQHLVFLQRAVKLTPLDLASLYNDWWISAWPLNNLEGLWLSTLWDGPCRLRETAEHGRSSNSCCSLQGQSWFLSQNSHCSNVFCNSDRDSEIKVFDNDYIKRKLKNPPNSFTA